MNTDLETKIKQFSIEILLCFKNFAKSPMKEITALPDWSWPQLLMAEFLLAALSGFLIGVAHFSLKMSILNLFINPIISILATFTSSAFFYYIFQFFSGKSVDFKKIFTSLFFAHTPFFIFQIIAGYFPPILLLSFASTGLLLIMAFVENCHLPRNFVIRLVTIVYALLALSYFLTWYSTLRSNKSYLLRLEQIEKEGSSLPPDRSFLKEPELLRKGNAQLKEEYKKTQENYENAYKEYDKLSKEHPGLIPPLPLPNNSQKNSENEIFMDESNF